MVRLLERIAADVTFYYSEYLRVFLNVSMVAGNEVGILGRIADCIQVNTR